MKSGRILPLLICVLMVSGMIFLPGCHGSRDRSAFESPETFDATREYELTFWAKNDTNKVQTKIYQDAIESFEKLYPNITVNLRLYTDYGKIYNDVITNIATDTTPNICITYPDHIATYLTGSEVVVSLDALIENRKYGLGGSEVRFDSPTANEVVPEFLTECKINGHYYALPYMRSTEACYVNKTYVEKLGYELPETLTWDYIWEVSEAAMKKDPDGRFIVNGQKVMIPFIYKSTDNMMIQMLRQEQAEYSSADGEIQIFNDSTKEILKTVAQHVKNGAFSTFKISSYPANFFNAGQCIFGIDSTAGSTWMGSGAPLLDIPPENIVEFDTEVMTIPQSDPENPQMISQGPSVCIFNKKDPQEVLASWLFMQYLMTNDVQIAYAETEGYVPVTLKAQNSEEYTDYLSREGEDGNEHYDVKIKASKLLLENMKNTFTTPVFNGSASLRDAAGQMIEDVAKSVRRKKNVDDDYIGKLFADVKALYRLDSFYNGNISADGKTVLGPLPGTAIALLVSLASVWVLIGIYIISKMIKDKQKTVNSEKKP